MTGSADLDMPYRSKRDSNTRMGDSYSRERSEKPSCAIALAAIPTASTAHTAMPLSLTISGCRVIREGTAGSTTQGILTCRPKVRCRPAPPDRPLLVVLHPDRRRSETPCWHRGLLFMLPDGIDTVQNRPLSNP